MAAILGTLRSRPDRRAIRSAGPEVHIYFFTTTLLPRLCDLLDGLPTAQCMSCQHIMQYALMGAEGVQDREGRPGNGIRTEPGSH